MSDKKLLNENTVRRFMKLANIDTFTDNFISDFRPISNAFISLEGNDYSLQQYYEPNTFQYDITSAPLTLSLSFDISNNLYNLFYV